MAAEALGGGPLLEADALDVLFGGYQILWGARLRVAPGEVVALLGPNGAGKSTLMNTLSGLVRAQAGTVTFRGQRIERLPAHRIVDLGLSHVLERRRLFPYLTVGQNVLLGAYPPGARARRATTLGEVEALFPLLQARWRQPAHTLSGGEQQMVAIARGLMACPTLLMIDEPFLGLAPQVVAQISQVITRLNRERGLTVVFIEQNVELALSLAHRGYVLESGRNVLDGPSGALLQSAEVKRIFLGA
jgi:branched-chain amino acid transport system ATP-binding protein